VALAFPIEPEAGSEFARKHELIEEKTRRPDPRAS